MEKMVLYKTISGYEITTEANYQSTIQNANLITKLYDFESVQDILDYCEKYSKIPSSDIYVIK